MTEVSPHHDYILSLNDISHISFEKYEKDFIFWVNGSFYKTSRFIADILSPTISKMHDIDETFGEFSINTDHNGDFNQILNLAKLKPIAIEIQNFEYVCEILKFFGVSSDLCSFVSENTEEITDDNVIQLLKTKCGFSLKYDNEIEYIASNFSSILNKHINELNSLDQNIMEEIISSEYLKINNEDNLLEYIISLYLKDPQYITLFEYVEFSNVSSFQMSKFIEIVNFNDITNGIWSSLGKRLTIDVIPQTDLIDRYNYMKLAYNENEQFNGIISYLSKECQGNAIDKGAINVFYSSSDEFSELNSIVNYDNSNFYFSTDNYLNQWICFDFKDKKVELEYYTIKTIQFERQHLRNWVIEGSNSEKDWDELDSRENCPVLNGSGKIATFEVANHKMCRYIRLRQTGPNWEGSNQLVLQAIEFYGKMK